MDTVAGKTFIRDLADFGVPVLMFSGGEPLLREDLLELADFAGERGIRLVLLPVGKCPDGYQALKQAPRTSGIDSLSPSQPSVWFQ